MRMNDVFGGGEAARPGKCNETVGWGWSWKRLVQSWKRRSSSRKRRAESVDLQVETLEVRDLMSISSPPNQYLPTEPAPVAVQLVNVAGELHDDMLSLSKDGKLTVAVNDGAGKWQSLHSFDTGVANAQGFAAGLFNGDVHLDVVVQGSDSLVLMVGDGQGNFTAAETILPGAPGSFSSGAGRVGLATGLFGADLKQDLVVLQPGANSVLVLHTAQDGKLSTATVSKYGTGGIDPVDVVVGDFVGDDFQDLAIGHRDGSVAFLAGDKSGGFSLATDATVLGLGSVVDLAAADLDQDGDLDLVVASTDRVTILSQDDDVLTTSPVKNGDFSLGLSGWTSTTDASALGGALQLREGTGLLSSVSQTFIVPAGAQTLSFDLVSLGLEAPNGGIPDAFEASLLDANGDSLVPTFRPGATSFFNANPGGQVAWGAGVTYNAATGRVTLDLSGLNTGASATLYFDLVGNLPGAGSTVTIDRVQITPDAIRTNHFTPGSPLPGSFSHVTAIAVGDVDGNGKLDLVVADSGAGKLVVYDRTPSGSYQRSEYSLAPGGTQAVALAIGNLTVGDSAADVAVALADTNRIANPLGNGYDLVAPTASLFSPTAGGSSATPVQQIVLQFSEAMFAAGAGTQHSVLNPAAYTVVGAGPNGVFGDADDKTATVSNVVYDPATHRATLVLNGGANPLGAGNYRVSLATVASAFVLQDLAGNAVQNGQGFQAAFTVLPPPDHTPPTATLTFTPDHLWPPNHQLVTVTAKLVVQDDKDPAPRVELVSIVSNEPDWCNPGDRPNDIQGASYGTDDRTFLLRAERLGGGDGRVYTITYRVTDAAGNSRLVSGVVRVAHDQGCNDDDHGHGHGDPVQPLEEARFVVVDDDEDRVYGYGENGEDKGEAELASGNAKARGVASSPDGETRWVLDANRKIYVYDRLGALKGSWTANGLNKPEDVTVVGNDVFIVDAGADRVYRYNGGALRLSGSQSASSSFSLNSRNRDATGVVSDGSRIWVTDEGRRSVFVYNMNGAKLGEWKLARSNSDPRGITISPTGGGDVWVVDGDDAKVYRYADGRTRLSGTGSIASSFRLDGDNDHPEGIADPPTNQVEFGVYFGGTTPDGDFSDEWLFEADAGTRLYIEGLQSDVYIGLYATDGTYVTSYEVPFYDAVDLPSAGTYRLRVASYSGEATPYQIRLSNAPSTSAGPLAVGGAAAGTISAPGAEVHYTMNLQGGAEFALRPTSGAAEDLRWVLTGPNGDSTVYLDFALQRQLYVEETGVYTLSVRGEWGYAGSFGFLVQEPQPTPLEIGFAVSESLPEVGRVARYSFDAAAGQSLAIVYGGYGGGARWSLADANGVVLFSGDPFTRSWKFDEAGTYLLTISRDYVDEGQTYQLFLSNIAPQQLTSGQQVGGELSYEDPLDLYRIEVQQNSRLDIRFRSVEGSSTFSLTSDDGRVVVIARGGYNFTSGPLAAGGYRIAVSGRYELDGGSYTLSIEERLDDAVAPEPMQIDEDVSGALDADHPTRAYVFEASAGSRLFFDALLDDSRLQWSLQGPDGGQQFFADIEDQPTLTLSTGGTYRLTVFSSTPGRTGSYQFRIRDVPLGPPMAITLGAVVRSSIAVPGEADVYVFQGEAGQNLVFAVLGGDRDLRWSLQSPDGATIFDEWFRDQGPLELAASGSYRIVVYSHTGVTTQMSFRVTEVPAPTITPIVFGQSISSSIDVPLEVDTYTLEATAGQSFVLEGATSEDGLGLHLTSPSGVVLFQNQWGPTELTLSESGTYRISVRPLARYNNPNAFGDYSFRVLTRTAPEQILLNAPLLGDNLDAAVHSYTFHLEAGQTILFDLSGLNQSYALLTNPWGNAVFGTGGPLTITATGEFTLQIFPGAVLGEFRFQVQEVRSPQIGALDSRGTEFWTGFGSNGRLLGVDATPYIFVAAETATSGTVQIPRLGFARAFTVDAGGVARIQLPNFAHPWTDYSDLGILVTALDEVSVYGVSQFPASSAGFAALPTDALGTDYMVTAYRNNGGLQIQSQYVIVATEDDTHVTITPPPPAVGEPEVEPETIVLQRGQVYFRAGIFGRRDVTGASFTADKKIAVLGGHGGTTIPDAQAADFVFEQMTPVETWGSHFFATPFAGQSGTQLYRVLAKQDGTEVRVNGDLVATLERGRFWGTLVTGSVEIETSAPALAAQFSLGGGYGVGSIGDPGMVLLPPSEQFLSSYTFATPTVGFPNNDVNLVVRGEGVGTITLDGNLIPAESFTEINGSGWFGASVAVSVGGHRLAGAVPFGAVIYGFNDFDSYLYAGGLALAPLAQATNLSLTPSAASLSPGSEHLLTAQVTNAQGLGVAGIRVDFTVGGANAQPTSSFVFTDAQGRAVFRYVGTNAGVDSITATVGDRTATAQVAWAASAATVEVTSPLDGAHLPAGKVLLSGQATAGSALGRIVLVTVDGKSVDALDPAGGFFALVDLALGPQSFTVEATDSAGQTASLVLHLTGEAPVAGGLDFSQGSDVTSQGAVSYAGTTYNRRTHTLLATMQLTNLSADPLVGPVVARVDRIGPGNAVLSTSEGTDPSGKPYVVFDGEIPWGGLAAGATSSGTWLAFAAAAQERFEVDVSLFMRGNEPPVFKSAPVVEAVVGQAYSYAPVVHDPNGNRLQFRLDQAPEGMTVNAATGLLGWTPTADQVGSHEVELFVSDGRGGEARQQFRTTVSAVAANHPPYFRSVPPTALAEGFSFDYTPVVADADHDSLTYTLVSAPAGAVFNPSTGRIQLANPASGNYGFAVRVEDGHGGAAVLAFVLQVGTSIGVGSPRITSTPPQYAVAGQLFAYQIEAADPQGEPVAYDLVQAPAGAIFDPVHPGRILWTPSVDQSGPQTFEVKADDGLGRYSTQAFTVQVLTEATNRPPVFASRPTLVATQGELYAYNLSATDPEGLPVSYEVLVKPASMTLVDGNRLVFTPGGADLGRQRILVRAVDPLGGTAYQQFYLDVRGANLAPEFTSSSAETATAGAVFHYDANVSDVDAVTFALVDGPAGATIDPRSGNLVWNTTAGDVGSHSIVIRATEERGLAAEQTLQLALVADHTAPNVYVMLSQNLANPGDDVTISVRALDDVAVTGLVFKVNGQVVQLVNGQYVHRATQGGFVDFEATSVDAQGNTSTDSARLRVFDPTDTAPPVITLDSPQPDSVVTYLTNIVGSISDANMDSYKLELSLAGMNQWRTISEGVGQVSHGLLGVFDPTMLENDYYDVRVTAFDVNGQGTSLQFSLSVEGNAKLGEFSLSYTDLTIPVAGIPITITRTYSTLHADQQGDFGYGWTLAIADANIRETRPITPAEREFGALGAAPFTKGTRVYLTAPSGERIGFTFDPVQDVLTRFGMMWRPRFVADPGVFETLEVPYAAMSLDESNQTFNHFLFGIPYNPDAYTLVTKEGVRYTYGQFDGLRSVEDRNGNTLTYTHDGIFASSGQSIQFVRDSQDRITQIIDPDGNALTYTYDAAGDLVRFEDQVGTKTSMFYDAPRAHYLSEVTNPGCGCRFDTYIKTEYDDAGRIIAQYDAAGNPIETSYDLEHFTESVKDRRGYSTQYTYDLRGNVTEIVDPLGLTSSFTFDAADNVTSKTDGLGHTTTYQYDAKGNVTRVDDPEGAVWQYAYNAYSDVQQTIDPLGRTTTYSFDASGNMIHSVNALGDSMTFGYDAKGRLTTILDARGNSSYFEYGASNHPTAYVNAAGGRTSIVENRFGLATSLVDENGNLLQFKYNVDGTLLAIIDALGRRSSFEWSEDRISATIDPQGARTTFEYDGNGRKVKSTDPLGQVTTYDYDANGNLLSETDPAGMVHSYVYRADGRVEAETWTGPQASLFALSLFGDPQSGGSTTPISRSVHYEYDAAGNTTAVVDANGNRTEYEYDAANRVTKTTDALGGVETYVYNLLGQLTAQTDANGRAESYTYDAVGRWIGTTNALGGETTRGYDASGNLTSYSDALGRTTTYVYNSLNRVTSIVDAAGGTTSYGYDDFGNTTSIVDALGRTTEYAYDAANQLTSVVDALGGETLYGYDLSANLTSVTDALGRITTYDYDALNQQTGVTDALGGHVDYGYDASGNLTSVTDQLGRTSSYQYDGLNRQTGMTDALGGQVSYGYDAVGNLTSFTDQLGRATSYQYDALNRQSGFTDALGGQAAFGYDAVGNLTSFADQLGRTTSYQFDALNRQTGVTDALGGHVAYGYDSVGNLLSATDQLNRTTNYLYDALDRQTGMTDALGGQVTFGYDAVGNLTSFADQLGRTTSFQYDSIDRRNGATDALGGHVAYGYDAVGNLLSFTDQLNRTTNYQYDALDRQTGMTDALGGHATFGYDAVGNLTSSADQLGRTTSYQYDSLNRRTGVTEALGGHVAYGHDAVGNLLSFTDQLDRTTSYQYDALDRQTGVTDALGGQVAYGYDAVGNLLSSTDQLNRTTSYQYDSLNRQTGVTDALGGHVAYGYDAVGNLLSFTDSLSNRTEYRYDALDRVVEEVDPLQKSRSYDYDAVGNRVKYTDRDDRVTEYRYDALDRTVGERWLSAAGVQVNDAEYAYDAVGNLLSAADAFSRYSFTYDALDRRLTEDNAGSPGQPHVVLTRRYDAYGNLVRTEDNAGVSVAKTYDARNQTASIAWEGLPGGASAAAAFQYDERGLLAAIERFADTDRTQQIGSTLFDYDELGRISELTHRDPLDQVLAKYDYAWEAASQLTSWTHHGETTNYAHDATGQLTAASGTLPEGYTYDAAGNRTGGGQTIGAGNQLLSDEQFDYAYDGEGNLVSKTDRASGEVTSYQYDHRNRMVRAETKSAGGIILKELSFTYDVFDRRIAETVDAQTTRFVYDGVNVWADYDASGQAVARYLFGDGADDLLARWTPPAGTAWYLVDHLGTVRDIVNSAGFLIDHVDYDSFGRVLSESNPLAGDRYKFTGREYVPALGLYYYRARFYDPGTGRFLSADPLSFAAGDENLYRYVSNRPLTATDPSGMTELVQSAQLQDNSKKFAAAWNAAREAGREAFKKCIDNNLKNAAMQAFIAGPQGLALWQGLVANCLHQSVLASGLEFGAAIVAEFLNFPPPVPAPGPGQLPEAGAPPAAGGGGRGGVPAPQPNPPAPPPGVPPKEPQPGIPPGDDPLPEPRLPEKADGGANPNPNDEVHVGGDAIPIGGEEVHVGGDEIPIVGEPPKGANLPKVRASSEVGKEAHRQLEAEGADKWLPEQTIVLPNGRVVRKDGVRIDDPNTVRIIKPDTPSGRQAASKRAELMQENGYDTHIDLYDPASPRFQPGSPTYIGPRQN